MTLRIQNLVGRMSALKINASLITDDVNITYLTGFPAHESWLLVTEGRAFYITDSRYLEAAEKGLRGRGVEVVLFQDSIVMSVLAIAQKYRVKVLGLDERHITMAQYHRLSTVLGKHLQFVSTDGIVDHLRMVKEPREIKAIREALKINLAAYRFMRPRLRPGKTEKALLEDLSGFARKHKVGFSFDPIIASGPNSAMPHARITERKLRAGEPVLIDCGMEKNGYKSDLTRMFFLGKMTPSFKNVLYKVQEAQEVAIKSIKPGVLAKDVDRAARESLKRHNLDQFFGHSLGHGVGLDIHEMPRISQLSGVTLSENMVFTVEPGVYFPGKFGIRLEEMVRVTQSGCEVLSVDHDQ